MAVVGMNGRTKESGGDECGRAKQAMENMNEELGKAVIRVVECEDVGEGLTSGLCCHLSSCDKWSVAAVGVLFIP